MDANAVGKLDPKIQTDNIFKVVSIGIKETIFIESFFYF